MGMFQNVVCLGFGCFCALTGGWRGMADGNGETANGENRLEGVSWEGKGRESGQWG